MKVYRLENKTLLKGHMKQVWDYFSTPLNLNEITPDDMSFEILTDLINVKMYPGLIINYRIRPFLNIPMRWTTEITHCEINRYFVDEQRFGPYAFWHHQHHFQETKEGIEMTDIVHYAIPFGPLGRLANSVYVAHKLKSIFDYREQKIATVFK
jgi:ligand-binding SRPBCC domain-containing protein